MPNQKNNDPYVREGWVGYRVVTRRMPIDNRTPEQKIADSMRQSSGLQAEAVWDMGVSWSGPLTVVAESEENWVVRSERGAENLLAKDQWIFLSVGDEKA